MTETASRLRHEFDPAIPDYGCHACNAEKLMPPKTEPETASRPAWQSVNTEIRALEIVYMADNDTRASQTAVGSLPQQWRQEEEELRRESVVAASDATLSQHWLAHAVMAGLHAAELEAALAVLAAQIAPYLQHTRTCNRHQSWAGKILDLDTEKCTCGLAEIAQQLGGPTR